ILLFFLPPLDLSVFSALKAVYRRYIAELDFKTDSFLIGKHNFLICYEKVRLEVTGLWLLNVNKPLNSKPQILPKLTHELEKVANIEIQIQKYLENSNQCICLFFRKVNKALDDKNMALMFKDHKIEELKLSKRLRVVENPNSKFVKILEIMKAKKELETRNPELLAVTISKLVESMLMEQLTFEFQLE
ncbi:hypothetical protein F5884DRAFT_814995, partial [Xylogone sp. PMI_703]